MRVPLSWLREYVAIDVPTDELAERLSMAGVAVDQIERRGGDVSGVVVAEVLEVDDVPDSKLCITRVDAGAAGTFQVLAGVRNFAAGDRVPLAAPGARVPTLDVPVGVRTMMGRFESQGMLCSAKELGVSDDHSGILVLDRDLPLGADVAALLALDDEILEFEIYPNRPDLMSVLGIAREVGILLGADVRSPDTALIEEGPDTGSLTSVTVEDAAGCPRYLARVLEGVTVGPSPALVRSRLAACGFRPISNIVDATNYVLLLTGQPLHAFDLDALGEERIVVRRARAGERIVTLDEQERQLDEADLVIADASRAQAIAGVMGGRASEVGAGTTRVLLESAFFDPLSVARTARRHQLRTEASARFERGADPEVVPAAAALCAEWIRRWAGGRVAAGAVDVGGAPPRRTIRLRPARADAVLGAPIPSEATGRFLAGLGCEVGDAGDALDVVVPSWRPDLEREIDLIEELARLHGYDRFPSTLPPARRGGLTSDQRLRRRIRAVMAGAGFTEVTLSTFAHRDDLDALGAPDDDALVRVSNPMTEDQRRLRPTLLAGLLRAAQHNAARGVRDVAMFEIGAVFTGWADGADLPHEHISLGSLIAGEAGAASWHMPVRSIDALDAKGAIEALLAELGVGAWSIEPDAGMPFHPGRSARVLIGGDAAGVFGELRPSVARAFDLEGAVAAFELALPVLIGAAATTLRIEPPSRFPPVLRDLTLAVDEDVEAGAVADAIRGAAGEHVESVALLDVYRGEQVGSGRKSLSFRLTFRAPDRTLRAEEADAARAAAADAARALGADVR